MRALDGLPARRYSSRQKKACANFSYALLGRMELDNHETNDGRDPAIHGRALLVTAASEVMIDLLP